MPASRDSFKSLVVKINSHVFVDGNAGSVRYGKMDRYKTESVFCGGLHALLDGDRQPAILDLHEAFSSEGNDRLATHSDPEQVPVEIRRLLTAVVSARLQARRALLDIQHYTPTTHLVVACVTLNRKQRDTELVVGAYTVDCRSGTAAIKYCGLGDDPSRYRFTFGHGLLRFEDDQLHQPRDVRDHRQMVLDQWQERGREVIVRDERLEKTVQQRAQNKHNDARIAKEMLTALLWILADVAPVPTAILSFAKGLVGVHHVYRAHRLVRDVGQPHDAKMILDEILAKTDSLSHEQVRQMLDSLSEHHGLTTPVAL